MPPGNIYILEGLTVLMVITNFEIGGKLITFGLLSNLPLVISKTYLWSPHKPTFGLLTNLPLVMSKIYLRSPLKPTFGLLSSLPLVSSQTYLWSPLKPTFDLL